MITRSVLAAAIIAMASVPDAAQAQEPPCEAPLPGVATTCAWIQVDGRYRVRSIVTRPGDASRERLPALLFVQWLSCDPVTVAPNVSDGWQDVLRALIQRSGMIVARTEKPGLGGSGGPACAELGYDEEVAVHRAALEQLRRAAGVAPDSIFIFGGSMGGTIAPQLASGLAGTGVRGIIVAGSTAGTWLEHMIALDRRVMELRGLEADSVHALMAEHVRFHAAYLGEARTPVQIATAWSGARGVWQRIIGTDTLFLRQYGRPVRFHHEAQRRNWPRYWAAVRVPVLVIHGEHDWIMPEAEHLRILRALAPEIQSGASYVKVPGMGHDFLTYPSLKDSFRGRNGRFEAAVADTMLGWLRARRARPDIGAVDPIRAELERLYKQNTAAFLRWDFAAVMALRAPDFHAILPDGTVRDRAAMENYIQGVMNGIKKWNSITLTIDSLRVVGDTAFAIVTQHLDRMALRPDNQVHHVETWVTQREAWVRYGSDWLMWRVDQLRNQRRVIDGREG